MLNRQNSAHSGGMSCGARQYSDDTSAAWGQWVMAALGLPLALLTCSSRHWMVSPSWSASRWKLPVSFSAAHARLQSGIALNSLGHVFCKREHQLSQFFPHVPAPPGPAALQCDSGSLVSMASCASFLRHATELSKGSSSSPGGNRAHTPRHASFDE